jgi:hypothetical protein
MNVVDVERAVILATRITEVSRGFTRDELVHAIDLIVTGIRQSDIARGRTKTAYEELGETWE